MAEIGVRFPVESQFCTYVYVIFKYIHMYSLRDKEKAIELRLAGKSYGDIKRELGVKSKGTLSVWLRGLQLTPEAKILLQSNSELATRRNLLAFNSERSSRIQSENAEARGAGLKAIGVLSRRDLLIVGAALYWGEGTKSEAGSSYRSLAFSNSDPLMVQVYLRFVREILKVPEAKIYIALHIYESIDEKAAREFWSKCTGLPEDRFTVGYQVSRASKGIRKTLPYGTISIRVHNRLMFHRVKGMISGLAQ